MLDYDNVYDNDEDEVRVEDWEETLSRKYPFDQIKELLLARTKIDYFDAVKLTEELEWLMERHFNSL